MSEDRIINLYIKYANNPDKYEHDYNDQIDNLLNNLNLELQKLEFKDLVELYLKYSNIYYVLNCDSMNKILDIIYDNVMSKFKSVSLMKIIDLYTIVFNSTIKVDESIEACKSRIHARISILNDEVELEHLVKSQAKGSPEKFINNYKNESVIFQKELSYYQKSFDFQDKLQQAFITYLDENLDKINEQQNSNLLSTINRRIEDNSREILKRNDLLSNKTLLDVRRRFRDDTSLYEIRESLDTTTLRNNNYVYENYKEILLEQKDKDYKKR